MARNSFDKQVKFEAVIQLPLLDGHPEKILAWDVDDKTLWQMVEAMGIDGYSIKVQYDDVAEEWSCQIFGAYPRCDNAGKMLYGNAGDMVLAIKVALFKHMEIANGGSWGDGSTRRRGGMS